MLNPIIRSRFIKSVDKVAFVFWNSNMARRSYITIPDVEDVLLGSDEYKYVPQSVGQLPVAHFVKGRYISPWTRKTDKSNWAVMKWLVNGKQERLKLPSQFTSIVEKMLKRLALDKALTASKDKLHVTWMGHASCYFQSGGLHFITDPVFSDRVSPFQFIGPKRVMDPLFHTDELFPELDVVLLSHTHYDHLDYGSALRIGNRALWIVPLGVKKLLGGWGITNVVELNWWDKHRIVNEEKNVDVEIVFCPTKHWTSRTPFDRNTCLWGSYVVASHQGRFFFSGDTAYCSVFKQIGELYGPFDMSCLAIGAYKPRWFMKDVHCDPSESIQIHKDLKSLQSVGIHWGTFPLADEDDIEPALELGRQRRVNGMTPSEFYTMAMGETVIPSEIAKVDKEPLNDMCLQNPELFEYFVENCEELESVREKRELEATKHDSTKENLNVES